MGKITTSATQPVSNEASNYDEVFMHQSLLFDDSLKDLKNLRAQLYSAAEYFELSYTNDDQKQIVVETLKDYAVKALVNTVDHLGSVTYKVNDLLDEKVVEVSVAELRVSCIEQVLDVRLMFLLLCLYPKAVRATIRETPPSTARRGRSPSPSYPSEPRKSSSMRLSAERDNSKDVEQYPSKSKRLLKALLSRRKSKKDDMLYTYLDEY
ncbi:hypothetical protein RJT34_01079 [Clitoria ternatea]|uniref:Uncharacterized protein n=1 Tax=Clitoria ternatea TaxID=43366 RepID=A0AAN9KGQ7_CLITE